MWKTPYFISIFKERREKQRQADAETDRKNKLYLAEMAEKNRLRRIDELTDKNQAKLRSSGFSNLYFVSVC